MRGFLSFYRYRSWYCLSVCCFVKDRTHGPLGGTNNLNSENSDLYQSEWSTTLNFIVVLSVNPLTPELNPSAQRWLKRFLIGILLLQPWISLIYAWKTTNTPFIHLVNNYVLELLHVSVLYCHLQGAFIVPYEGWSIKEQLIEYCEWTCCV
jgi:hypothetical protein